MLYKENWEETKGRFLAWWNGDVLDRVALQVSAPKDGCTPREIPEPRTLIERWLNIDWILEDAEEGFRTQYYGGEAFPCFFPNLGPDACAAFLGADLEFRESTSWVTPLIESWDALPEFRIDPENRWWRWMMNATEAAVKAGRGKYFVGIMDIRGGADFLASLRGRENFCLDLIDHPDEIRAIMAGLTPLWLEIFEACHQRVQEGGLGSSTWLSVWSPGRYHPLSMDELALMSAAMFEEFFLEDLLAELGSLDHSLFHLDGPDAIRHLDILLDVPELHGIQWVPGARYGSMLPWIPLLKRIQSAGKLVHVSVRADEVEQLLRELSPKGLMLRTGCSTQAEAQDLLRKAAKWTRNV